MGLYKDRSMTAQERRFEDFVNVRQTWRDIDIEYNEWVRCKGVEEEAIRTYYKHGENMDKFLRAIITHDQAEMEFQCVRKKEKEERLRQLWGMELQRLEALAMQEAATIDDAGWMAEDAFSTEATPSTGTAVTPSSTQQDQWTPLSQEATPAQSPDQVQPASEKKPRTINLFTPEEEEEFCREFLGFYPPMRDMVCPRS